MALRGIVPVPEIQFDGFSYPAFDQIVSHLAKYRMRTHGDSRHGGDDPDPVVRRDRCRRAPLGVHRDLLGAHRRAESGCAVDPVGCLLVAAACDRQPGPGDLPGAQAALLEPRRRRHHHARTAASARRRCAEPATTSPSSPTAGWSATAESAAEIAAQQHDWDLEVVDLRSLKPLDFDTVAESVRKTGRVRGDARGAAHAGLRRRTGGPDLRGVVLRPGGTGAAGHRIRHPVPAGPAGEAVAARAWTGCWIASSARWSMP